MKTDNIVNAKKDLKKSFEFFTRLTNQTGIIQHTKFGLPDRRNGYSLDDNARALIVSIAWYRLFGDKKPLDLAAIYLAWLYHAKTTDGYFYNFSSFDNQFKENLSEDGFGRAFWALGYTVFAQARNDLTNVAKDLISETRVNLDKINSPRAIAYCLLGLYYLHRSEEKNNLWKEEMEKLADKLVKLHKRYSSKDWNWFEEILAYSNHLLPLSLFKAYLVLEKDIYRKIASSTLDFVENQSRVEDIPAPIGNHGWFFKGGERAVYDQQPIEASEAVLAHLAAFQASGEVGYIKKAMDWLYWYQGNNTKKVSLIDSETGACFDSLIEEGVNQNQGAESIIAYLMARLALVDLEKAVAKEASSINS